MVDPRPFLPYTVSTMNDTNNLTATPKMFSRFCTNQFVKDHVREAKRVGYTVTKDNFGYTIMDGTNIVMKGLKFNRDGWWMIRFSSLYWNESAIWKS